MAQDEETPALVALLAELERGLIAERTKAGVKAARPSGRPCGSDTVVNVGTSLANILTIEFLSMLARSSVFEHACLRSSVGREIGPSVTRVSYWSTTMGSHQPHVPSTHDAQHQVSWSPAASP